MGMSMSRGRKRIRSTAKHGGKKKVGGGGGKNRGTK